jgi:SAM-dependent methyltransferase
VSVGDASAVNRAHWDELAARHGVGLEALYDTEALVSGASSLHDVEEAALADAVGDVAGLDVIHVQCHIGFDTISLARRGARVTGIDISPTSLSKARELAARCGVQARFIEADATALPHELHGRFDVAYATIGVFTWIDDLGRWMRSAAACLRRGGKLVAVDLHPLYLMLERADPLSADWPYAHRKPIVEHESGSYAGPDVTVETTATVQFAHSLGDVVTAAARAGLRVDALQEHLDASFDPRGDVLVREADGRFRVRLTGNPLPVLFTLLATR